MECPELIHRTSLRAITGSTSRVVLTSALIFALVHSYEGAVGVISVTLMGLWDGSICGAAT